VFIRLLSCDTDGADEEDHSEIPRSVQSPTLAEFFGAGDHLYRNYHPSLTSTFPLGLAFCI
jgi:hypothetical protein